MGRAILEQLGDEQVVALQCDAGEWPHGFLSATAIPDAWMGLLEGAAGWRKFVPAGDEPRGTAGDRLTLVRSRALALPFTFDGWTARGGEDISVDLEVLLAWPARDDDLAALGRHLRAVPRLTLAAVEQQFRPPLESGLRAWTRACDAADIVDAEGHDELATVLRTACRPQLLDWGLTLQRVARCRFRSRTLAEQRARARDAAQRIAQIEARTAIESAALGATRQRLTAVEEILAKLKSLSAADPNLDWHALLPALHPAERARLLANLWRITPNERTTRAIVVVAGRECLWLEPAAAGDAVTRRQSLPPTLGPLRSVAYAEAEGLLLVGAAQGVWRLAVQSECEPQALTIPNAPPQSTGFNAATIAAGRIYATHSGLGCWSWPLHTAEPPLAILRPENGRPRGVRAARAVGPSVYFAADRAVYCIDPDEMRAEPIGAPLPDTVYCLAADEDALYAGAADGGIYACAVAREDVWRNVERIAGPVETLAVRGWGGLREFVVAAGARGVEALYPDENVATPLLEADCAVRRAWASDDCIVALSEHRDRLFVLPASAPERTPREVPIGRLVGHSVQDVCIVTGA